MSFTNWFRGIQTRWHGHRGDAARERGTRPGPRYRPRVEILEDRCLPATLHWFGIPSSLGSNPVNWLENQAPANGDSLVFAGAAFRAQSVNNLSNLALAGISFAPSSGFAGNGFTLSGNSITL